MTQFRHKRKLTNYVLKPGFQFKYGFYFLIFGVLASILVQWLSYVSLRDAIINFHVNNEKGDLLRWLDPTVIAIGDEYFLFLVCFGAICFGFGIWITHRIVGPGVAIKRFIGELRKGKFGHHVKLRDNDQLYDIANELNHLSEFLAEKYAERQPQLEVIETPTEKEQGSESKETKKRA